MSEKHEGGEREILRVHVGSQTPHLSVVRSLVEREG